MMLVLFLSYVLSSHGFLLEPYQNKSGQAVFNGQYMTVAEFYDEKNLQHQDMERLRQDMDKKLVLLANQMKRQFGTLSADAIRNETKYDILLLQQKYATLEQNYNKLQTSNIQLQNAHSLLQSQYNILARLSNDSNTNFRSIDKQIEWLSNKSAGVEKDISDLKQLGNIKPLQEISALEQNVQNLKTQTHTLNMKERARSQDFLALVNMTVESKKALTELKTVVNAELHNQTLAFSAMENRVENRLQESEKHGNLTFSVLQNQINDGAEKVAITAYIPLSVTTKVGEILRFANVKYSVGINDLSSFKTSGKFRFERRGLYLIAVSILTETNHTYFYIYLNNIQIAEILVAEFGGNTWWHTGTTVFALQIDRNDSIWVTTSGAKLPGGQYCSLTVVKLK